MTGRLKWFNNDRGYGFIAGDDGNDYFIHASNIEPGEYNDEDKVTFETLKSRKGLEAIAVRLA